MLTQPLGFKDMLNFYYGHGYAYGLLHKRGQICYWIVHSVSEHGQSSQEHEAKASGNVPSLLFWILMLQAQARILFLLHVGVILNVASITITSSMWTKLLQQAVIPTTGSTLS